MERPISPTTILSNGNSIPQLGFGIWKIAGEQECRSAVATALEVGYRHIDTAQIYENEEYLGMELQSAKINRAELFLTTKIWNDNLYWDDVLPSFETSLTKLKTDYVDLLLIHFPVTELRRPAWRRLEEIYRSGTAKTIERNRDGPNFQEIEAKLGPSRFRPGTNFELRSPVGAPRSPGWNFVFD